MVTRFTLFAACWGLLATSSPCARAEQLPGNESKPYYRAELIFQPTPRFPRCHSSTITVLPDGTLIAAWWNGSEEGATDVVIRAARRLPGKGLWETPRIVSDTPGTTEGNPVLFAAPNGEVWLFHRVGLNPWKRIVWFRSRDRGRTWTGPTVLIGESGWTLRSRIVTLQNGDIVIPAMKQDASVFLISSDRGETWRKSTEIVTRPRNNEATLIQRRDGSLLAFMRPYDPPPAKRLIWQSESVDNGRTWSAPARTGFHNPSSAIELLRLRSGAVVLVFNDDNDKRTPLNLAISEDEGRTWNRARVLEDGAGRFEYPTMTETADGRIHISYSFRRLSIKHIEINEAWIRERFPASANNREPAGIVK